MIMKGNEMVTQENLENVLIAAANLVAAHERDELSATTDTVDALVDSIILLVQLVQSVAEDYDAVSFGADGMIEFFLQNHPVAFSQYLQTLDLSGTDATALLALVEVVDLLTDGEVQ